MRVSRPKSSWKCLAHALGEELLPAVAVLGQRGVGVRLAQRRDPGVALALGVVDAGGRGEEVALHPAVPGGHQQVCSVDQDGQHAVRLVGLDEAHAAHVGGQVVDPARAGADALTGLGIAQVGHDVLHAVDELVPLRQGLAVHRAHAALLPGDEVGHQMSADESPGAGDDDDVLPAQALATSRISETIRAESSRPRPARPPGWCP